MASVLDTINFRPLVHLPTHKGCNSRNSTITVQAFSQCFGSGSHMGSSQSKADEAAHLDNSSALKTSLPAPDGYFGEDKKYGGAYLPPPLEPVMKAVFDAYMKIKEDPAFLSELTRLRKEFIGRPSPIFHCKNLSDKHGGAQIYLKRRSMVRCAL